MKLIVGPTQTQARTEHWTGLSALTAVLTVTYGDNEYCYVDEDQCFPTGLLDHVLTKLRFSGIEPEIENPYSFDHTDYGVHQDYLLGIELRDYQLDAIEKALLQRRGIIKIATGGGKTEIQAAIARALGDKYGVRTLTVVSGQKGCNQSYRRFLKRGLTNVGRLGGEHWDISAQHLVATVQTLHSKWKRRDPGIIQLLDELGLLQFDECHHEGADSWYFPGMRAKTERKLSYSATPFHDDPSKMHPYDARLIGLTGPMLVNVSSKYLRDRGFLVDPSIFMVAITTPNLWGWGRGRPYHKVETNGIISNGVRNSIAVNIARNLHTRHRVAFLVKRIYHGIDLLQRLTQVGLSSKFCCGGATVYSHEPGSDVEFEGGKKKFKDIVAYHDPEDETLEEFADHKFDVLIGSGIFDEVVDLPMISCLVILSGGKKAIRSLQRVGRAIRPYSEDPFNEECLIFDFDDNIHPWLKNHSRLRVQDYKAEDYRVEDQLPLAYISPH